MSTAPATTATTLPKKQSVATFLNAPTTSKFLQETLNESKSSFVSNLIAITNSDKKLQECDPKDLMMCALDSAALKLPLNKNLGYAYVIAYKGVPSFQIGYKGLIQLAIRTGQYKIINSCEVREGEILRNKFTGEIKYLGEFEESPVVGYMACLKLNSGFEASVYMSEAQIEAHAVRYSQTYKNDKKFGYKTSKWSDFEERPKMAKKTVLKALLGTYGVLSVEMVNAMSSDDKEEETTDIPHEVITKQSEPAEQEEPSLQAEIIPQGEPEQEKFKL